MFSYNESRVIKELGRRKCRVSDIAKKLYPEGTTNANNIIVSAIRRINDKCEKSNKNWRIVSKGLGRNGKTIWRVKV